MYSNTTTTKPVPAAPKSFNIPSHLIVKNLSPITHINLKRLCSTAANSSVSLYELKPSTKAIYRVVGLTAWSQLAISAYFGPLLITKAEEGDPAQANIKKAVGVGVIAYGIAINVAFNIFRKKIALKVDYVNDKVRVGMMNLFTATKTVEFPTSAMIYKKQLPIGESSFYTLSFRNPYNQDKTIRYYLDKQGNYPNIHVLENLEQRAASNK